MIVKFYITFIFLALLLFACKTGSETKINVSEARTKKIDENYNFDELEAHMEALFNLIEKWIAQGNFEAWYNSISRKYKYYLNNPANLKKIAEESDYLYNRGVELRSPRDYFRYVVMESREGKMLKFDGYKYINNNHVKVFCLFDKKDKFVYDFIYEDGSWKIDR